MLLLLEVQEIDYDYNQVNTVVIGAAQAEATDTQHPTTLSCLARSISHKLEKPYNAQQPA